MVDLVGKVLTPLLLVFIGILIIINFLNPIGPVLAPAEAYMSHSFFKGFQEGYLTMDALAAFVFGIIIINIMRERGATTKKEIMISSLKVALVAGTLLAIIYSSLSYMGATSASELGHLENGGAVLAGISYYYFGSFGKVILAFIVIAACLTTSIGLITACASYFNQLVPSISYKSWATIFTIFSAIISNVGLSALIEFSVPVLLMLYPICICLMFLTFMDPLFKGKKEVYQISILFTFIVSIFDGLSAAGIVVSSVDNLFESILPLYSVGLGWLIPAVVGGIIGYLLTLGKRI
ncbi:branched-chain amino acid transport system carrier protein [Halalkalibacter akibai JCM 9157]|uniref:Branched-chain amino acid transport system carrier protein n=1 Tax=Halalkalibacter akibai (strain ATCC 43226 / DSM 21942 / CIP 109018 / JCM 9157 / 1139) TaxID=1236973 RepID=W4R005_HALA3|nr:branched-chain amino acid transport system carrier protein [Halalkalibacter akibai JCM 9157]